MTREEAIAILNREIDEDPFLRTEYREKIHEALKMAIKALEQQESDDFARWVAREIFDEMWEYNKDAFAEIACRKLAKLGIVRSTGHEWELVEQEPCEDAISRQDVLDLAKKGVLISNGNFGSVCKAINKLPPVNPQPKTGHWVKYGVPRCGEQHYKCTSCGYYINFGQWGELYTKEFKYCPSCGAKMVESQESENKSCSNCKYWLLDANNENRKCKYCFEMDEFVAIEVLDQEKMVEPQESEE